MRRIVILLCLVLCFGASIAQRASKIHLVSDFVNLNDSAGVYEALNNNTPVEPVFRLVPKFAIVGADSKFVFSIGASMKFTASYDWGHPVRNPMGMATSAIVERANNDRTLCQMSAGGSGIFFNIIGFPSTANQIGLFISIGVDNESNNTYKLAAGQVYMRYRDFQCGYATSLYNDRGADAYLIDAHGPCSSGAHNSVGMNWQHYFNQHIRMGVGLELPQSSYTQIVPMGQSASQIAEYQKSVSHQNAPDLPLYLSYIWRHGHVRFSSVARNVRYVDLLTLKCHNVMSLGIKLTSKVSVGPVDIFAMAQAGRGAAGYFQDNADAGLDLVPDNSNPGRLIPTKSWGSILGVTCNITPKIFATAQCSYLRNYTPKYDLNSTHPYESQMRKGLTATTNVVWRISSLFSTGLEYRYGRRTNEDLFSLSNNRMYAMLLMNF